MTFRKLALINVVRNKRVYTAYFLSSVFSVSVFFIYALFAFHPAFTIDIIGGYVSFGMHFAELIIYIFSIFFVLYSMSAFLKSRKKEFGILAINGMSDMQLRRLVFLENMLIGFFATSSGILIGLLFAKLLLLISERALGMTSELPFYFPWQALLLTFLSFFILFLFISIFTTSFVRGSQLIDLFTGGAKPKPTPKASRALSYLAVILLGLGYTIALLVKEAMVFFAMIPVTIIVIIGTYLFYTQLSVYFLNWVRKKKRIYQHKTNLVVFSYLIYRMKDNAQMFFIVTIVLTITFSSIGTLVGIRTMLIETTVIARQGIDIVLFIGLFIGAVFFISSGSFLYFRLYTDLEDDKRQFGAIAKLGLTDKELSTIITLRLALLFFFPILVATIHGAVSLTAMQNMFSYPLALESILVLGSFFIIQVVYFLIMRAHYLIQIKKDIIIHN
ncbi:FtsX-like permease family protein [Metabacillus arenae]|uniref:FtsX-like permease family protein n=1 Tax=Metabacillus arenae TaxID=2771434 RepID=A0A926NGV9_9BACI|nr:FtsX-like permease family protein [Metabacillus arenae]MBD1383219.1 FtsX-like permease family protein [Metabacillus arenae]